MANLKSELESDKNALFVSELIKDRLYFVTYKGKTHRNIPEVHFFSTDEEFNYNNYYNDFGPLNLLAVYKFSQKITFKLKTSPLLSKRLVQFTSSNPQKRANAAFLIATYCLAYLNMSPREVYDRLSSMKCPYLSFQDASPSEAVYTIRLIDCFNAFKKALFFGLVNLEDFDVEACEKIEKMYGGDMSWIVPQKILAFSSPLDNPPDRTYHAPKFYIDYFHKNNVKTVVRLNLKMYDSKAFIDEGIAHYDLFFQDGGVPTPDILERFLQICESSPSAVAVHCKAGLGRTGCLIGAYLVKHYRMTALEAIAWMRICRPGCVIGSQQTWLEDIEPTMWSMGDLYRMRYHGGTDVIIHHKQGVYSRKVHSSSDEMVGSRPSLPARPSSLCLKPSKPGYSSIGLEQTKYIWSNQGPSFDELKDAKVDKMKGLKGRKIVRPNSINIQKKYSK